MRIGMGFDAHAFADGVPLILGGVEIDAPVGLVGHSDADVLSHAVADALLGAAGLGDLGARFPATDEWRDASSIAIVEESVRLIADAGYGIRNVDATVIAQTPRLAPYVPDMVANLAAAMGVVAADVSVKATSTDGMGFTGRGEGIAALAAALVAKV